MSKLTELTDLLPGGEARAAGRMQVEQAIRQKKEASANAKATKETVRPIRTKVIGTGLALLAVGTVYYLNENNGGEAIGEAVSESAKTGVNVVAGVGSVGVDVASGVLSGTREGVSEIQDEANVNLDNPFTRDENGPVSNTTPVSLENGGETGASEGSGSAGQLIALKETVTITEVPVGEDGVRNYSAAGVIATPIQVAKECFNDGSMDMTSAEWEAVYNAEILTADRNFLPDGAFYGEQTPTLNPDEVVYCQ